MINPNETERERPVLLFIGGGSKLALENPELHMSSKETVALNPVLSQTLFRHSLKVESPAASVSRIFSIDQPEPRRKWPNLISLVQLLAADKDQASMAECSQQQPRQQICVLQLLRGVTREARSAFQVRAPRRRPEFCHYLDEHVGFRAPVVGYPRLGRCHGAAFRVWADVVLDTENFMSHGDAFAMLEFLKMVVRPISMQQISAE
ncbi:hypothetical protein S40293_10847 [Stachybotrys chartarum IBT 40293]|nr:hypothetical protein S40293_10847 [Stachybotrys chartarum IBT 40293]